MAWYDDITPARVAAAKEKKRLRRLARQKKAESAPISFYPGLKKYSGKGGKVIPQHNTHTGWYQNQIISTLSDSCTDEEYERIFGKPAVRLNCMEDECQHR